MILKDIFTLLAVAQGSFALGSILFIILYHLPKKKNQLREKIRWHIISILLSYLCLTLATIKTASSDFYKWGDVWYWIVSLAYIVGDISIIVLFRELVIQMKKLK